MIDLEFVRSLIAAVDASGIDTVEVSRGDTRIRISKTPRLAHGPVAVSPLPAAPVLPVPAVSAGSGGPVAEAAAGAVAVEPAARPDLFEIKSPMVGTYYRGPAPEAPPYVDVGSHVVKGQTLCILEAMKLMNELESEVDGVVREVLVDNAEPVEFGQVLFRIELKR